MGFTLILLIAFIIYIITRILIYKKTKKLNILREFFIFTFFIYFLGVLFYAFFKYPFISSPGPIFISGNLIPFKGIYEIIVYNPNYFLFNVGGNLIMLYPLGIFIPLLYNNKNNLKDIFKLSLLSTLSIEIIQLLFNVGSFDIDDIILNTLGAVLGYLTYILITKFINLKFIKNVQITNRTLIKSALKFIAPIMLIIISFWSYNIYTYYSSLIPEENLENYIIGKYGGKILDKQPTDNTLMFLHQNDRDTEIIEVYKIKNSNKYERPYHSINLYNNITEYTFAHINDSRFLVVIGKNPDNKENLSIDFDNNYGETQHYVKEIKNKEVFWFTVEVPEYVHPENFEDISNIKEEVVDIKIY